MLLRRLFKALTQPLNAVIGGLVLILTFYTESMWLFLIGLAALLYFVVQKLRDEEFVSSLDADEKLASIRKLDNECERLADTAKNSTNSEKRYRVREVLRDKNDIIGLLVRDKDNSLKQKIARQAIELIMVYIRLIENYYSRLRDIDESKVRELEERIRQNEGRLETIENPEVKDDLQGAIDLDKRLLSKFHTEKDELSILSSKISYIESTVNLFKQQMVSSIEEGEILNEAQDVVNEAIALDNVLTERKKLKGRL